MTKTVKFLAMFKYFLIIVAISAGLTYFWQTNIKTSQAATDQSITDVNGDGVINLVDARILAPPATTSCPVCVDVNGDKKIDEIDVKLIQYHAGLYAPSFENPIYRFHPRFDVNNDKTLDDADVQLVQNYLNQTVSAPAFGLDDPSELTLGFVAGEILIRFKPGITNEQKQNIFSKYNLANQSVTGETANKVTTSEDNVGNLQKQIKAEAIVEAANKNHIGEITTDDPLWPQQWGPQKIRIEQTWFTETTGNQTVKVAVLDTGADYGNSDLQANLSSLKYNAFDGTDVVTDNVGHGTRVAGIIGATANNQIAVAGLNWQVEIIPVKVCDWQFIDGLSFVTCPEDIVNLGLNWAVLYGANVINLSLCLGFDGFSNTALYETLNTAAELGVNVIAGTGNLGRSDACFPANHPKVTAIGASNPDDSMWEFSNGQADYLAPGVDIITVQGPDLHSGTSFATPHAAGVAALCRAVVAENAQHRSDLNCGRFEHQGFGRIDAWATIWYKNCHKFDFNSNGFVGVGDAQSLAYRYNDPSRYNIRYDIAPVGTDGKINLADALLILARTSLGCPEP